MYRKRLHPAALITYMCVGLLIVVVIIATILHFTERSYSNNPSSTVRINQNSYRVLIADTPDTRARGLCCRDYLAPDSGMLFVFDNNARHAFWMKDTTIALDIIWIDDKKRVVEIADSVQPSSYPTQFAPKKDARYVLELVAGSAKADGIRAGDQATFVQVR